MRLPWREDSIIIPWLVVIVFLLLVAFLFKIDYLSKKALNSDKDFYAALSSIVTIFVLVLGSGLSYIRFFKGRTLQSKIVLELKSGVINIKDENLHWIEVEIKNTGSVTIWDYQPTIIASLIKGKISCKEEVTDFINPIDLSHQIALIDVGESGYEHAFHLVSKSVDIVNFYVEIKDKYNHTWGRALTVKNAESKSDE